MMLFSIFLDLIPLLLAMMFQNHVLGIIVGLACSIVFLFVAFFRKAIRTLMVINVLYFLVAIVLAFVVPSFPFLAYGQASVYLILTVSTAISLGYGEMFTVQYAKSSIPEAYWKHPVFRKVNRTLTLIWVLDFALALVLSLLMPNGTGVLLANLVNVIGVGAMFILPKRLKRSYQTR